nr:DUF6193 family natural product biosynthesis protein [Streptomyces scabiei]
MGMGHSLHPAHSRRRILGLRPLRDQSVGPAATSQQAVTMVVDRLPPDCGPAFVGTREELAAHDAATSGAQDANRSTHQG